MPRCVQSYNWTVLYIAHVPAVTTMFSAAKCNQTLGSMEISVHSDTVCTFIFGYVSSDTSLVLLNKTVT